MRLKSDRLRKIAFHVGSDSSIADIGTDHGYLPIYLVQNEISPHAILTDINSGPLKTAWKNVTGETKDDLHISDKVKEKYQFRQGDGLIPLEKAEVDVVVIAGMGGDLMVEILSKDYKKSCSFSKFIFQPRTNSAILRKWLFDNSWSVICEDLAEEYGRICELIVAAPNVFALKDKNDVLCATQYTNNDNLTTGFELSDVLLRDEPKLLKSFLEQKINIEEKKLLGISQSKNNQSMAKSSEVKLKLDYLKQLYVGVKENDKT